MNQIVLITGSTDLSENLFNKFYVPKINDCIKRGNIFIVGGSIGCDYLAKLYLADKVKPNRVIVFDIKDNDTSNIRINKKHYKFKHNNAF
jgi:hypothetical protein